MNPATLVRIWEGLGEQGTRAVHTLHICAGPEDRPLWPQTVYSAVYLGYLVKTKDAYYMATTKLVNEMKRVNMLRKAG